jgi:hypothetical protein
LAASGKRHEQVIGKDRIHRRSIRFIRNEVPGRAKSVSERLMDGFAFGFAPKEYGLDAYLTLL